MLTGFEPWSLAQKSSVLSIRPPLYLIVWNVTRFIIIWDDGRFWIVLYYTIKEKKMQAFEPRSLTRMSSVLSIRPPLHVTACNVRRFSIILYNRKITRTLIEFCGKNRSPPIIIASQTKPSFLYITDIHI